MGGADVYARSFGRSATDIANDVRTTWWYDDRWHKNRNLRLKVIWSGALAACGYDPEEIIYSNSQVGELSESDGTTDESEDEHDSSEYEDEDDDNDADVDEDEDKYNMSEDEDKDSGSTRQDDDNKIQFRGLELSLNSPNNTIHSDMCSHRKECTDDESREQTGPTIQSHFDWSTLEDDTNVWRT